MATKNGNNGNHDEGMSKTTMAVGAAAAAAVAAAGAYWFYGTKDASKHRKSARGWMLRARGEVLDAVEAAISKAGEIDKETYAKIVEGVLSTYQKSTNATSDEMLQVTRDMQAMWQHMQKARKFAAPKKAAKKGAAKKGGAKKAGVAKKTGAKKGAAKSAR